MVGLIVAVAGLLVATWGIGRHPPGSHEVYVLETTREMHDRGDWIVPYFNAEPRLRKPPLSYWATGLVAAAATGPGGFRVEPWHGRLVSAFAGVGVALLVLHLGILLYDPRTGLLGAGFLLASTGFFTYTHNARPDMLYAFWCSLGLVAYVEATRREGRGRLLAALGTWAAFGAATLTKGPQFPLMLLLAFGISGGPGEERAWLRRTLKPAVGIPVWLAMTVPVWWLLDSRLGGTGLAGTQLVGTLFRPEWSLPYFLYRPLQLVVPWLPVVALLGALEWRTTGQPGRRLARARTNRFLAATIVVPAVLFGLGPQRRFFYLLPAIGPMALLLAAAVVAAIGEAPRERWVLQRFASLHAALAVAAVVGVGTTAVATSWPEGGEAALALATAWLLAMGAGLLLIRRLVRSPWVGVGWSVALVLGLLLVLGPGSLAWSKRDRGEARVAAAAVTAADPGEPILVWGPYPEEILFHARPPVASVGTVAEVTKALGSTVDGEIAVIAEGSRLEGLPPDVAVRVLERGPGSAEGRLVAALLRAGPRRQGARS